MLCQFTVDFHITLIFISLVVPPGYDPSVPQGYPPQQQAYPPQQQAYPPPTQGYAPAPAAQQQATTNVVVVGGQQAAQQTTIIQQAPREKVNHVLHLIITFFFLPWIFVWMILCCIYGC